MKPILLVVFCLSSFINGMENTKSFVELMRSFLLNPHDTVKNLEDYSTSQFINFRDEEHNNLIHIIIKELIANKNKVSDYAALLEHSKPLLRYMVMIGIRINELNDNHQTPIFLAYADEDTENFADDFLHHELGAHPTYFSLEPELRRGMKILKSLLCCKKNSTHLKSS